VAARKLRAIEPQTCGTTGLRLVPARSQQITRIAKTSYGAMNPQVREEGASRATWGRFDVPNQQVVYGAVPEQASYAESLAALRLANDIKNATMGDYFDGLSAKEAARPILEVLGKEWANSNHMPPKGVTAGWRGERRLYKLTLPPDGWFVDVCHSDSLAAIDRHLRPLLDEHAVEQATQAALLGENRELTTSISAWIWNLTFDDGSRSHGVKFPSKHGADFSCHAIYMRALGDGKSVDREPTQSDSGNLILPPAQNQALRRIGQLFDIQCH
jgi:hypothetical protein